MTLDIILLVPEDTDTSAMPQEQVNAINYVKGQFPSGGNMPGTKAVDGMKLVHAIADAELGLIESMINGFGLQWIVLAAQDEKSTFIRASAADIAKYTGRPVDDILSGKHGVHTYFGHRQWEFV